MTLKEALEALSNAGSYDEHPDAMAVLLTVAEDMQRLLEFQETRADRTLMRELRHNRKPKPGPDSIITPDRCSEDYLRSVYGDQWEIVWWLIGCWAV